MNYVNATRPEDKAPFYYDSWFVLTALILSVIGFVTNLNSLIKTARTFDIKKPLYLILAIDSGVTVAGFIMNFISAVIFLTDIEFGQTRLGCNFFNYIAYLNGAYNTFLLSLIGVIR